MKRILITGGNDGLGKVAAGKFIAAGFAVTILGHDEGRTKAAAEELGCKYVVADVADHEQVAKAIAAAGEIDILINNAAIWTYGPFEATDPELIHRAMEVNALGTMYCTHAVVPAMKARKRGRIINVISQAGLQAKAERSAYNASKWAITGFTKSMQLELKSFGISVVGFYPAAMQTNLMRKAGDTKDRPGALDPAIAADALVYICNQPDHVDVPEFGVQSLDY